MADRNAEIEIKMSQVLICNNSVRGFNVWLKMEYKHLQLGLRAYYPSLLNDLIISIF